MDKANLAAIQQAVAQGDYRYTAHALQRTTVRHISRAEIEQAIVQAEIIESYPEDKYGPSALVYGETEKQRILHIQISLPPSVKIITAYEPDPDQWENYRVRK
jgi:hypothetical protein